jgi:hypothetical protein
MLYGTDDGNQLDWIATTPGATVMISVGGTDGTADEATATTCVHVDGRVTLGGTKTYVTKLEVGTTLDGTSVAMLNGRVLFE